MEDHTQHRSGAASAVAGRRRIAGRNQQGSPCGILMQRRGATQWGCYETHRLAKTQVDLAQGFQLNLSKFTARIEKGDGGGAYKCDLSDIGSFLFPIFAYRAGLRVCGVCQSGPATTICCPPIVICPSTDQRFRIYKRVRGSKSHALLRRLCIAACANPARPRTYVVRQLSYALPTDQRFRICKRRGYQTVTQSRLTGLIPFAKKRIQKEC
jgi:hypothetical protein